LLGFTVNWVVQTLNAKCPSNLVTKNTSNFSEALCVDDVFLMLGLLADKNLKVITKEN